MTFEEINRTNTTREIGEVSLTEINLVSASYSISSFLMTYGKTIKNADSIFFSQSSILIDIIYTGEIVTNLSN